MCSRGIYQLKKLTLQFCDWGGSSKGVRDLLESDTLKQFIKDNPQLQFEVCLKRGRHPFFTSTYVNGFVKDYPIRNLQPDEIMDAFKRFRASFGRIHIMHAGKKVYGPIKSVQGEWKPNMFNNLPKVELEKIREPVQPNILFELVDKETNTKQFIPHQDFITKLMKKKMPPNQH